MNEAVSNMANDGDALEKRAQAILLWYKTRARPAIESHAPEIIGQLDSDSGRISRLLERRKSVTACFLGHSGIGKSTLLNALADGRRQVVPAGGKGPLTAKATEVHFSEVPSFEVTYQQRNKLQQVIFALEQRLKHTLGKLPDSAIPELDDLDEPEGMEDLGSVAANEDQEDVEDPVETYIKQAKQLITDNQFSDRNLEYLIDALRMACSRPPLWESSIHPSDAQRIKRIQQVLTLAKDGVPHRRQQGDALPDFVGDLTAHSAGFLAPLIATIRVGWPSDLLESGVVLVDLPGIGIAQDAYRSVTKAYVRDEARVVVLVVDRSGPTEDTITLLRTSGYWDRLVGASDDPDSDPCRLVIAVTRVDDVANEIWTSSDRTKKRREVFVELVAEFKTRMRAQISEALKSIGPSANQAVSDARTIARERLLQTLEVHPVSAPQYRMILLGDDDDRPFLKEVSETGVPELSDSLARVAIKDRTDRLRQIDEVTNRFADSIFSAVKLIRSRWEQQNHASLEAARVASNLETFAAPKRKEFDRRVGGFREYLEATVKADIRALVLEARVVAESDIRDYLKSLRNARWNTLRAAVRRGGTFYGSRHIDLPNDIADRFTEPMAAVWSQRLLKDIRSRTSELAHDISRLVGEICAWANEHGGATVRPALLKDQRERISGRVQVMRQVGKEAVDELREIVKRKLSEAIQKPIRDSCLEFVKSRKDVGSGVKERIMDLFEKLAKDATEAAQAPATSVLRRNFEKVRKEIQDTFDTWGDPIQETMDIIVERHEQRVKRSDVKERDRVLSHLEALLEEAPDAFRLQAELAAS